MLPLTNLHPPRAPQFSPFWRVYHFCREFGLLHAPETRMNRRGDLCTMNKRDHFVDSESTQARPHNLCTEGKVDQDLWVRPALSPSSIVVANGSSRSCSQFHN